MNKDTTVYVKNINLKKIEDAARKTNVKSNDIIIRLFQFAIKDNKRLRNDRTSVEYQVGSSDTIWITHHVRLPKEIAVFCMDMRRFYSKSASLILGYSVGVFLEKLINILLGIDTEADNPDNYQLGNYNFNRKELKNGICWTRNWKLPHST